MKNINRKDFLKKSAIAVAGGTSFLAACSKDEQKSTGPVSSGKTFEWRMVTTWTPHFPLLGEGADMLAKNIETMSNGRFRIKVYGAGELVPALETFDAVSQGVAQMGHGAAYYWAGKAPACQFFTALPFGMNTQQSYAWLFDGGGMELWRELYDRFNLVPFPAGNTGSQMGGWFNKKINSVSDLKGLKMRIPGIGGKIITLAGGSAILSPGGEIYTNLERGVIDATDWVGPYHDWLMGFHKIAKYYYYPTFAEPTAIFELIINKNAYNELPDDLKEIVKQATRAANIEMLSAFENKNQEYLHKIRTETDVQIIRFPDEVIKAFRKYAKQAIDEIVSGDEFSKKVYDSYKSFQEKIKPWADISEKQTFNFQ